MTTPRAAWLLAASAAAFAACGAHDAPRTFAIGEHRVSARVPAGWEVLDQGRQVRLRGAGAELVLQDLGAAGPVGLRREVERAQDLWRAGRVDEARWRLYNVPLPEYLFATPEQARAFRDAWSGVTADAARALTGDEPARRFVAVMGAVAELREPTLPELARHGLAVLGHDERRDVRASEPVAVAGGDALDVQTWNRLAHTSPRRFVFVRNDDFLLVLYTAADADGDAATAFTAVRDSLQLLPAAAASDRR